MKTSEQQNTQQRSSELMPDVPAGGLMSFDKLDDFFDDFISRRMPRLLDWNMPSLLESGVPRVNMVDHDNDIEVQVAVPGIKKEELDVSINNQMITIRANKQEQQEEEKGRYFRHEIMRGEFQRTLSLPVDVDGDKAQASFHDGILKVTIPKAEQSKRKTIEIH